MQPNISSELLKSLSEYYFHFPCSCKAHFEQCCNKSVPYLIYQFSGIGTLGLEYLDKNDVMLNQTQLNTEIFGAHSSKNKQTKKKTDRK